MKRLFTEDLRLILTAFLLFFSLSLFGQDWKYIGGSAGGYLFYYSISNLVREGDIIKTWNKLSAPNDKFKLQEFRLGKIKELKEHGMSTKGYETYSYTISREEYDCKDKLMRIISSYDYNSKGVVIYMYKNTDASWSEIVPESIGEIILNTLRREILILNSTANEISDSTLYAIDDSTVNVIIDSVGQHKDYDKIDFTAQIAAQFPGGLPAWTNYLERNLNRDLPVENGAPPGKYTVTVSFLVDTDGSVFDVKAENDPGYGTGDEAVRVIKEGPNWKPAVQYGRNVIYRHKQSITFTVSEEQ
ncbi:MAG: hypothetical protein Q8K66_10120 [Sediminibacterium sp.]|nr:hypothetical protein [Sediminibacterium sp.]